MYITAGLQFSELTVEVNNAGKSWASYAIKSSIGDGELGLTCSLGFLRNYRPRVCFPRVKESICLAEALDAKDFTKQNHKKKCKTMSCLEDPLFPHASANSIQGLLKCQF